MNRNIAFFALVLVSCALCRSAEADKLPTANRSHRLKPAEIGPEPNHQLLPTALMKRPCFSKSKACAVDMRRSKSKMPRRRRRRIPSGRAAQSRHAGRPPAARSWTVIEYTGSLLLSADLALLSGKQVTSRSVSRRKASEKETLSADISSRGRRVDMDGQRAARRRSTPREQSRAGSNCMACGRFRAMRLLRCAAFASGRTGFQARHFQSVFGAVDGHGQDDRRVLFCSRRGWRLNCPRTKPIPPQKC